MKFNIKKYNIINSSLAFINTLGGIFKSMKKFFKLDEEQDNNIQNEISNNINNSLESGIPQPNKTEGGESFISQKVSKCKESILKKVEENLEVERSFKTFGIMVAIGLTLLCLSLMFLPVVIISPSKFVMCFSLGSLIILSSFIFVYGTKAYVEKLFAKNRFTFSILFLLSIILGLYFSFAGNYFISILLAVFQLITLIVFTLTFLPGGSTGISFIGTMLMTPVKGVWNRITGRAES